MDRNKGQNDIQLTRPGLSYLDSESESKFRTIADYTADLERWFLPDGTVGYISPSCLEITGFSREELSEDPELFYRNIFNEDRQKYIDNFNNSLVNKEYLKIEFRIVHKNGEIRWLDSRGQPVFGSEGKYLGIRVSGRDVTDRKLLEEKLRQSEEMYKSIVNTQRDPICRMLPDGRLTYANNVYLQLFGLNPEEIPGKSIFSFMKPEDADYVESVIGSLKPEKPYVQTEHQVIYGQGSAGWINWINAGIFDSSGELVEIEAVGRDITELRSTMKKLESALREINMLKDQLEIENVYLKEKIATGQNLSGIVTRNPVMLKVIEHVKQVAISDSPVLITGETGTGKELIAKAIHEQSDRKSRSMVTVNCAAIPSSLIESELFGREKGAYTGALTRQIGRFELADRSTIFLDEVAELPPETQSKLLRVIQFGEFQMLGSPVTKKVNARIIAATNRNLLKAVEAGTFRSDLFYRLNVFPVSLPPLRERKDDIPLLVWNFVEEFSSKMGKRIKIISQRNMDRLAAYPWPGNIRELRNIIEYSMILSNKETLNIHLHDEYNEIESGTETLDTAEKKHIIKVLNQTNWRVRGKGGAAELLGINESTLRFRMKKLGIHRS